MAMLLSRSTWAKLSVFRKNGIFLAQKVFISAFLVQIRNQRLKIDPCAKLQPDWTKDKGSSNFDLEQYRKLLDDTHTYLIVTTSANLLPILRDFVPEYHHANFGGNWTTKKEKQRGAQYAPPPPAPIFYQNNPA